MSIRSYFAVAAVAGASIGAASIILPRGLESWSMAADEARNVELSVTYGGCHAVRAAGKAPLHRGAPGYRSTMDGDHDGVACEDPDRILP